MILEKVRRKKKWKIKYILPIIVGLALFLFWQNNHIVLSEYEYENRELPRAFHGYKILHISDLHNKSFGKGQSYLIKEIEDLDPDIILVTGDLIDRKKYDLEIAMTFINRARKVAPIYYVSGNHEAWSGHYENIKKELIQSAVIVLDNEKRGISREGEILEFIGLMDPAFYYSSYFEPKDIGGLSENLERLSTSDSFKILLSHRPELFDIYALNKIDMIFSGHAHGGQFRFPGLGGLVAPDQGFFPKYSSGVHRQDRSTLYISRGLGNSIIPIRIFNRPELIMVTLFKD